MRHQARTPHTGPASAEGPRIRHVVGRQSDMTDESNRTELPGDYAVHTYFTDDGLVQGTAYFDFLGGAHYVVARREIALHGFAGDDMVAVKQWQIIMSGSDDPTENSDDLIDRVKSAVVDAHGPTAEQWQKMLAKVEARQVPWA